MENVVRSDMVVLLFKTCAPLTKFEFGSESKSVYGSCFAYDGSAHQIRGSFEKYLDGSEQKGKFFLKFAIELN